MSLSKLAARFADQDVAEVGVIVSYSIKEDITDEDILRRLNSFMGFDRAFDIRQRRARLNQDFQEIGRVYVQKFPFFSSWNLLEEKLGHMLVSSAASFYKESPLLPPWTALEDYT